MTEASMAALAVEVERRAGGGEAMRFLRRLPKDNPPPYRLDEPFEAPDGQVLKPGSWVVLYRAIIFE